MVDTIPNWNSFGISGYPVISLWKLKDEYVCNIGFFLDDGVDRTGTDQELNVSINLPYSGTDRFEVAMDAARSLAALFGAVSDSVFVIDPNTGDTIDAESFKLSDLAEDDESDPTDPPRFLH